VVITGIAGHWGTELARALERDPSVEYLAGIDTGPPAVELERTDLIEADIRSPLLSRLLPATRADTVVHCGILWYPEPGKPARMLHDVNVIGTLQLLAACQRMETLERVVVRGSAAIYGCEGPSPSFFTEQMAGALPLRTRFQRDIRELEGYFDNFARRYPRLTCCMLRYQPEIGPDLELPLVRYLSLPVVPTQLGFDPRLQLLHAEDATGALVAATRNPARGAVNVAPAGAISLSHILRLARRPSVPIPHPLFGPALERLGRYLGAGPLYGDGVRLLRFGRGVDNRRLRRVVGYEPQFDAVAAVRDFAAKSIGRRVGPSLHPGDLVGRLAGIAR
jgi:UDP-glucose 4-epimerase